MLSAYRRCVIAYGFTGAVGVVDRGGDGEAVGGALDAVAGYTV